MVGVSGEYLKDICNGIADIITRSARRRVRMGEQPAVNTAFSTDDLRASAAARELQISDNARAFGVFGKLDVPGNVRISVEADGGAVSVWVDGKKLVVRADGDLVGPVLMEFAPEQAIRLGTFLNSAAEIAIQIAKLESCATQNKCYRYKDPTECACNPGHRFHSHGCSNVNPVGGCPSGAWCKEGA